MNNGQNNPALSQELVLQVQRLIGPQEIITAENHSSVLERIRQCRQVLDAAELQANERFSRWQNTIQALQARVQAGAEARRMLERLGAANVPSANNAVPGQAIQDTSYSFQQLPPPHAQYATAGSSNMSMPIPAAQPQYPPSASQPQQAMHGYQQQQSRPQYAATSAPPALPQHTSPRIQTNTRIPATPQIASLDHNRHYTQHRERHSQSVSSQQPPSATTHHPHAQPAQSTHHPTQIQSPVPPFQPAPNISLQWNAPAASGPSNTSHPGTRAYRPQTQSEDMHHASTSHVPGTRAPIPQTPSESVRGASTGHASTAGTEASRPQTQSEDVHHTDRSHEPPLTPKLSWANSQAGSEGIGRLRNITNELYAILHESWQKTALDVTFRLILRQLFFKQRLTLTDQEIASVNSIVVDPLVASQSASVVDRVDKMLEPVDAPTTKSILQQVLRALRFFPHTNHQIPSQSSAVGQPSGSSVTPGASSPAVGTLPSLVSHTAAPVPPPPSLAASVPHPPSVVSHVAQPLPNSMPLPAPAPLSAAPVIPHNLATPHIPITEAHTHIGGPGSTLHLGVSHAGVSPPNRPTQTVLRATPAPRPEHPPRTPPTSRPDAPLTPNTKTLARDILRSLGRPTPPVVSAIPYGDSTAPKSIPVAQNAPVTSLPQDNQDILPRADTNSTPSDDQKLAEREIIVIDDEPSVATPPPPAITIVTAVEGPAVMDKEEENPAIDEPMEEMVPEGAVPQEVVPEVIEEIQTPGVIQMAYQEVQEMLQKEPMVPIAQPSIEDLVRAPLFSAPASPHASAVATPPPLSSSSTSPVQQTEMRGSTPEPPPVAGPSKEPLFFASSPPSSASVERYMVVENEQDDDIQADGFIPTGLLDFDAPQSSPSWHKGKGRALDSDSDEGGAVRDPSKSPRRPLKRQKVEHASDLEVVESSEPEERAASSPRRRWAKVEVVVPRLSERSRRIIENSMSPSKGTRTHPLRILSESPSPEAEDSETQDESDRRKRFAEERSAVELSSTRLRELSCRWSGCDAILDSARSLAIHAKMHALEQHTVPFICGWEDCGRRFSSVGGLGKHSQIHSESILPCAYANCDHKVLMPRELVEHNESMNHSGQPLKPSAAPTRFVHPDLPPLPQTLPAYMSVPFRVLPARITRDAHVWVGSKIAANITCYVHPGSRPNAAAPSRASRRLSEKVAEVERRAQVAGRDPVQAILHMSDGEYDSWIVDGSQRGPRYCDNVQSIQVTYMVMNGLLIGADYLEGDRRWPPKKDEDINFDYQSEEDAPDVGNESDRTAVFADAQTANQAAGNGTAVAKVDEMEVGVAAGPEMQDSATEQLVADAGHIEEMLHQSRPASPPTTHDDQHLGGRHDVSTAASETVSQPGWEILAREIEDVDGML